MGKSTMNRAILIGRLGRDPEFRYTPKGTPVTMFNLATDESYKGKDGEVVTHTDWHRIVAWRKLAEICGQYLKKGSLVCVEGTLRTRSYHDGKGVERFVTEIVADNMRMLGSRPKKSNNTQVDEGAPAMNEGVQEPADA